jgi:hypothetical protein
MKPITSHTAIIGEIAPATNTHHHSPHHHARPLAINNAYPDCPHAAADILAYHECADHYIMLLSTDKALRYQPACMASFGQWLRECGIDLIPGTLANRIEERLLEPRMHTA